MQKNVRGNSARKEVLNRGVELFAGQVLDAVLTLVIFVPSLLELGAAFPPPGLFSSPVVLPIGPARRSSRSVHSRRSRAQS